VTVEPVVEGRFRAGDIPPLLRRSGRRRADLGFTARTSLADGMREAARLAAHTSARRSRRRGAQGLDARGLAR
jgi:hypothetical protein